jgi:hypothetical protein
MMHGTYVPFDIKKDSTQDATLLLDISVFFTDAFIEVTDAIKKTLC